MFADCFSYAKDIGSKAIHRPRHSALYLLGVSLVAFSAFYIWKLLIFITQNNTPLVVVLSGSMEPGYFRGDTLLLSSYNKLSAGDIVVFQLVDRDVPIVHRVINLYEGPLDSYHVVTKGDNNTIDDRSLYPARQFWLTNKQLLGISVGFAPSFGVVTIWFNEYPLLKTVTAGILILLILLGYD